MADNEPLRLLKIGLAEYSRVLDYNGRSNRSQFWTFAVINLGLAQAAIAVIIFAFLPLATEMSPNREMQPLTRITTWYLGAVFLLSIPYFPCLVRRLHDIGKSGCWALPHGVILAVAMLPATIVFGNDASHGPTVFGVIPNMLHLLCCLIVLVWGIRPSAGMNRFGEPPVTD